MSAVKPSEEFGAFYERHWRYVYRLCFTYMRSEADAEDCTEDVFVKVLNGNFTFTDETHERKWLTVTASNLCKDRLKSFAHRNVDSLDADDAAEPAAPPPKEDYSDVKEAVLALPEKLKDVVWMYYYDGLRTDEIAAALGSPPSTIRNRLKDARERLRHSLRNSGYGDAFSP
ncbi:MAG: sigma-70 family RNA polymerase sigma factor [Lachnospiraceae bacterium]|nr:sigma-70 family RNA polymerase sigma factor [Lachnospiraceae bacterium]